MKSITKLTHDVAALLKEDVTESNRFKSMDLCERIRDASDRQRNTQMRETMRRWTGKLQTKFEGSPIG